MFSYHPEIIERYPTIRAGVVYAAGLVNGPSPEGLLEEYRAQQRAAAVELAGMPLADIPSIGAWRRVFSSFGVKPTQYRSAAEALLRRLSKHGGIPSINSAVDIANLASIRRRLPAAAMDQATVDGSTEVRFAGGGEQFTGLGGRRTEAPPPGEVIFADEAGVVSARRWCWRQSAQSAAGPGTSAALYTVEGHHPDAEAETAAALADLIRLLEEHQPQARLQSALLSPDNPGFTPRQR